jgi:hypothetical protein
LTGTRLFEDDDRRRCLDRYAPASMRAVTNDRNARHRETPGRCHCRSGCAGCDVGACSRRVARFTIRVVRFSSVTGQRADNFIARWRNFFGDTHCAGRSPASGHRTRTSSSQFLASSCPDPRPAPVTTAPRSRSLIPASSLSLFISSLVSEHHIHRISAPARPFQAPRSAFRRAQTP